MPEQPSPDLPFECRFCRFWVPLDDVALLMSDGWRCVCYRCWRRETEDMVPEREHLPFAPAGGSAGTAVAEPPEPGPDAGDGVVRLRWWCNACQAELHIPLTNLRRPVCPYCNQPLRRWDERFPPDRSR